MNDEQDLRERLVATLTAMADCGLNRGTSGNVSVRWGEGMLISPTGLSTDMLTPESIVYLDEQGREAPAAMRPSSEWQMHWGLYQARPDVAAVVHCHSRFATTLACAHRAIPPLHYMVAVGGRKEVPLAPYHPFGSAELAAAVVATLQGGNVCLMANHGQIVAAVTLERALAIAEEIEEQAAVYFGTLCIGGPALLSDPQMDEVMQRFRTYGQSPKSR